MAYCKKYSIREWLALRYCGNRQAIEETPEHARPSAPFRRIDHRSRCGDRPASPVRHRPRVRQSRLDRAADVPRLPGRFPLRARLARGRRGRDGRRPCAGHRQCGGRQPAFGGGRRQRDGQSLHRLQEPHAADRHRGPAGARDPAVRSVPRRDAGRRAAEAIREMEHRARACAGCAGRDRTCVPHRDAGAARPGVRVDPGRRLGPAGRAATAPRRQQRRAARPGRACTARRHARCRAAPRVRGRCGRRSRWCVG
ncbi:hypothetical protein BLA23254_07796 [Burkholderia lata]|uniref:Uncharacterized protein n=1 Tax=Burkholderia lata (strain ATCC 17760 / DSM 23089 / LMG 22485 / NCIMB 9086 / R18194 / 383) TaxID=482957 RepID=A0A6P2SX00_BURL3|nr:hypothetical protein BLA23254_07796 [Burkholderia lata]